jgi:YD repeat-containing protein
VKQLDDPDRGTTIHVHDGFGELVSTTDALGRVATFDYDGWAARRRASISSRDRRR